MKIELKKIKISLHLSEETTAFTADIFVNGINAGYAKNTGQGGCTDYHHNPSPECRVLIQQAETHCLKMPPIQYGNLTIKMNLEEYIDNIINEELTKRDNAAFEKKLQKKFADHIIWGNKNKKDSYSQIKLPKPLSVYTVESIQKTIDHYKAGFKPGETFWNTNLESRGIKL